MTTEEFLVQKYGLLLTLVQVSSIFDRTPEGLRVTLAGENKFANQLRPAKVRVGRRVYFRAAGVAAVIDNCQQA